MAGRRVKIIVSVIVLVLAIIVGWHLFTCGPCRNVTTKINMKKVNLITTDNIKIVGNYYPAEGERGVILAHQLGLDKSSWGNLPELLQKDGLAVLAIDLRGHGESDLKYQNFSNADFNNMTFDIESAQGYLQKAGKTKIDLVGSSIGANLSLIEKGNPPAGGSAGGGFVKIVALSPGLNFKGLDAEKGAKAIALQKLNKKDILLIASQDDVYSYDSAEMLERILDSESELITYQTGGHGIALLANQPELKNKIINFLNN